MEGEGINTRADAHEGFMHKLYNQNRKRSDFNAIFILWQEY